MSDDIPAVSANRALAAKIVAAHVRPKSIGKFSALFCALTTFPVAVLPAKAMDNLSIERLATCQDSWLDWKQSNPVQMQNFVNAFQSDFLRNGNDPFFVPKSSQAVAGLPVAQVFPQSVGMGVGFSVMVNANFDKTKTTVEKKIGKSLKQCESGENMRTCALEIGEKKTIMLMAGDNPKSTKTLLGCYYFYEK
jgi:hypothetical protein